MENTKKKVHLKVMETMKSINVQRAFVWISFLLMISISVLVSSSIQRENLKKQALDTLMSTQIIIEEYLRGTEAFMLVTSRDVEEILARGDSESEIKKYFSAIHERVLTSEKHKTALGSIFGVIDIYGGKFISSLDQTQGNYNTKNRPWYAMAVEANGKVVTTQPYMDAATGKMCVTHSIQIKDSKGHQMGVLGIDVFLEEIDKHVLRMGASNGGFGILADSNLVFIVHPQKAFVTVPMVDVNDEFKRVVNDLLKGLFLHELSIKNYKGEQSVIFLQRMENGWRLAFLTPFLKYYASVIYLALMLIFLGVALAAILSYILHKLAVAKEKADKKNKEMAHWYKSLLNSLPFPISTQDMEAKWLFVNTQYEKYMGKESSDIIGKPCHTMNSDLCNTENCAIECAKRGQKQMIGHYKGKTHQINVEMIKDITGQAVGYIEIIQDVTEKEQILRKYTEAEAANKAKSSFLAMISHEIRTPMNAILGAAEMQMQKKVLPEDTQEALDIIHNSGSTLLGIINDLLDMSKLEAGKLEIMPARYSIESLISDTVQQNIVRIKDKSIKFNLFVDMNIPSQLYGDDLRIKQILNNLLSNAIKYTKNGEIGLSVSMEPGDNIWEVTLVFCVSDTGIGMSAEQLGKLFDEYTRFNARANRTTQGTGLGMGIAKRLVDMMSGNISVESELGKGSVVTVRLPQKDAGKKVLGSEAADKLMSSLGRMPRDNRRRITAYEPMPYGKILIVDDMEANVYVAKGLMLPYQLSVDTVLSGPEAIDKIKNGNVYDIIFMDHMMPDMDGMEATKIIRDFGYSSPIVALTADAVKGQAEMFIKNGFDDFVPKPIDPRQLDVVLKKLVRSRYSPETIKRARAVVSRDMAALLLRDMEKALAELEIAHAHGYRRDDDLKRYVISVHGMKSVFANIGEAELSATAKELEAAGYEKKTEQLLAQTPAFIENLRVIIEKIKEIP